jgi:hypothetical protein
MVDADQRAPELAQGRRALIVRHLIALALVLACGGRAPAPVTPVVTPAATTLPAEDASLLRWRAVAAGDKAIPANRTAAVDELLGYLASPDPARRDGIAYELLARWIAKALTVDEVRALRDQLLARLAAPLDAPDGVYARSFAALVLASVAARDREAAFLTAEERRALLVAVRDYAHRETDLRGYTGERGWAHAAAHTADLLVQLAEHPAITDDDRATILDAVGGLIVRRHGQIFAYGEDGRLAVAVISVAHHGFPRARLDAWLATVRAPLTERGGAAFDAGLYAAQRNARNLLFTLFVQGSLAPKQSPGLAELVAAVRDTLVRT